MGNLSRCTLAHAALVALALPLVGCLSKPPVATERAHLPTTRPVHFRYVEQLTVTSDPAGMAVHVDGRRVGETPVDVELDFGWLSARQAGVQPAVRYVPGEPVVKVADRPSRSRSQARRERARRREKPRRRRDSATDVVLGVFSSIMSELVVGVAVSLLTPARGEPYVEPQGAPTWTSRLELDGRPEAVRVRVGDGEAVDHRHVIQPGPGDPVLRAALGEAGALGVAADEPSEVTGYRRLHVGPETADDDARNPRGDAAEDALPPLRSRWLDEKALRWLEAEPTDAPHHGEK